MASLQLITKILLEFSRAYNRVFSPAEIKALADVWAKVLSGVADDELSEAVQAVIRQSRFFPTPADVMATVEENRRKPVAVPARRALPAPTASDIDRWIAAISGLVCRKSYRGRHPHPAAVAYFEHGPGMNSRREDIARNFLGEAFIEFEDWQNGKRPTPATILSGAVGECF